MLFGVVIVTLILAMIPALLFLWNLFLYRVPAIAPGPKSVSILIPARNEERSIEACLHAALSSEISELEVVVLDDHSTDATAQIVTQVARQDKRVKLKSAPALPAGWCGKQFACAVLADLATHSVLCFIDADVRLAPSGVARMVTALRQSGAGLISGFPLQVTETPFEQLLLPLMHFLLLGFLPLFGMRKLVSPAFGAGCGQIFVADREAYRRAGGHSAIRSSRHDGITLPRAFRCAGILTDLCDATGVASCRMYHNGSEVFFGLLKNATEGLASPGRIVPFSVLLLVGQVLPIALAIYLTVSFHPFRLEMIALMAVIASYVPRLVATVRFRQPLFAALFHPLAVLTLLGIQWYALTRFILHIPATWKGRSYSTSGTS